MFTRLLYHNVPALAKEWYFLHRSSCGEQASIVNTTALFQHSIHDRMIAGYFLIDCKSTISIKGDAAIGSNHRDVRAEWLGLPHTFNSEFSLSPLQEQTGVILAYDTGLGLCSSWPFLQNLRWGVQIPIVNVKNNLHPYGQAQDELIAAFNQPAWHFAKISNNNLHRTGVAEFIGRLSTVWLDDDHFFLASSLGIGIPTTKKQNPDFLFSPFVGPNGHISFINSVVLELPLYQTTTDNVWLARFIFEDRFYYPNHQLRTLDLNNKPWSRYLLLRREGEVETVPAMNILTQCVKVSPNSIVELQAGVMYQSPWCIVEAGYGLWGRHHEQLKLAPCPCEKTAHLLTDFGISGTGTGSASTSTIAYQAPNDPVFIHLKETDLNLCGSGSSGSIVHRFYIQADYLFSKHCKDLLFNIGGFFETPQGNSSLRQWGIWGSINIAF